MGIFQKLFGRPSTQPGQRNYAFNVKCLHCAEIVEGRVDLDNDLSVDYESNRDVFHARKVLMGNNKCFQRLEVNLQFTFTRELIEKQIVGGEFV